MFLKKFLNDESKSPVKDFLLWLIVYPFVIAFAVACVAFIFSFSVFRDIKITDWITSLSTMFFTGGLLIVTARAAKSWREQKIPDLKSAVARNIIDFDTHAVLLTVREFKSIFEIMEYNSILLKKYWDIEHSISILYLLDKGNKPEIDNLFLKLLDEINDATDLIKKDGKRFGREKLIDMLNHRCYKKFFPITKDLFNLVIGQSNVVGQNGSS